jgi:hypothetical protein
MESLHLADHGVLELGDNVHLGDIEYNVHCAQWSNSTRVQTQVNPSPEYLSVGTASHTINHSSPIFEGSNEQSAIQ